jgi:hypothetical protein
MTADSPAKTTREPVPGRGDRAGLGLPAPTILSMCDHLLGEPGRRHHMFTWLRAPGSGTDEWLAVDAYYPRARLVVMCRSRRWPHDALYRELVPAHGLGLLTLDPVVLGLAILIEALSRALGTVAAERAPRRGWACACAIVGAPVVAWVALAPGPARIEAEPAPLAGLLALLAGVIALVGLLTGT